MTRPVCIFCGNKSAPSKKMKDKPEGYKFICHSCRQMPSPDEYRCTYINKKGKQCGHWKAHESQKCGFHNRGEYK